MNQRLNATNTTTNTARILFPPLKLKPLYTSVIDLTGLDHLFSPVGVITHFLRIPTTFLSLRLQKCIPCLMYSIFRTQACFFRFPEKNINANIVLKITHAFNGNDTLLNFYIKYLKKLFIDMLVPYFICQSPSHDLRGLSITTHLCPRVGGVGSFRKTVNYYG